MKIERLSHQPVDHQPVLRRIDVRHAVVMALEMQPARRDRAFQRLQRRARRAGAGRDRARSPRRPCAAPSPRTSRVAVAAHGRAHGLHPRRNRGALLRRGLRRDSRRGRARDAGAAREETAAISSCRVADRRVALVAGAPHAPAETGSCGPSDLPLLAAARATVSAGAAPGRRRTQAPNECRMDFLFCRPSPGPMDMIRPRARDWANPRPVSARQSPAASQPVHSVATGNRPRLAVEWPSGNAGHIAANRSPNIVPLLKKDCTMLYEIRTYGVQPHSVPEVEKRFGEAYEAQEEVFGAGRVLAHRDRAARTRSSTSGATRTSPSATRSAPPR